MKFFDNCDRRIKRLLGYSLRKVFITSVQAANALNGTPKNETIAALSCKNGKADLADGTEVSHPKKNFSIFHSILNITIICPAFNTSIFGKYHHLHILQFSHLLMCSCFIPRSPLRLPTTLRTTRTRPSAAGRSGNYSRKISQAYENKHQRSRRRGGACLV